VAGQRKKLSVLRGKHRKPRKRFRKYKTEARSQNPEFRSQENICGICVICGRKLLPVCRPHPLNAECGVRNAELRQVQQRLNS